ncbi:hypothetical protein LTR62_006331 [Meristemomyces frigidus]|uniref:BAG domain-containing protein n=1 Tax=Meristemomyces frigidus TaxID=1508187 RepID=A0AAN7YMZ7_9PEZI|nr:hypothetical protein LTR62_006331 [Meristemomyces frigidus]
MAEQANKRKSSQTGASAAERRTSKPLQSSQVQSNMEHTTCPLYDLDPIDIVPNSTSYNLKGRLSDSGEHKPKLMDAMPPIIVGKVPGPTNEEQRRREELAANGTLPVLDLRDAAVYDEGHFERSLERGGPPRHPPPREVNQEIWKKQQEVAEKQLKAQAQLGDENQKMLEEQKEVLEKEVKAQRQLNEMNRVVEQRLSTAQAHTASLCYIYANVASLNFSSLLPFGVHLNSALAAIDHFFSFPTNSPSTTTDGQPRDNTLLTHLTDFLTTRTSLESTSIVLAFCTFLVLAMSWATRFNNLGRFSPFTRSPPPGNSKVSDADFSYITAEDLRRHGAEGVPVPAGSTIGGYDASGVPPRDTDALIMRNKRKDVTVHFPAYSIDNGNLTIGDVRDMVAKKMGTSDPRRIKLLYRGKNLKDDSRPAKAEGLRHESELLCTVAESLPSADGSEDDDDEDGIDGEGEDGGADGGASEARKRRNRGKKSKKRNKRMDAQTSGTSTPSLQPNTQQPSRAPSPKPTTPIGKIDALRDKLHRDFLPEVRQFLDHPPADRAKKDFDHKRLSETILAQILLKLDAVETEGDPDARAARKELVRETQAYLNELDAEVKR